LPHLTSCEIFQAFIDPNCNVSNALDRYLKPSVDEIVNRYKIAFQHLKGLSLDENLYLKIDRFDEFANDYSKKAKMLIDLIMNFAKFDQTVQTKEIAFYNELKNLEMMILNGNYMENVNMNSDFMTHLNDLSKMVFYK